MITRIKHTIIDNANSGNEQTVNDALHFGMGLYIYSDVAKKIGFEGVNKANSCFVGVLPEQLDFVLNGLLSLDGYLSIDNLI